MAAAANAEWVFVTTNSESENQVLIIAAEASSSLYAQRLIEHWQKNSSPVHAFGVGSDAMVQLGFEAFGRSEDMAVMGLTEVLAHFKQIRHVFYKILDECKRRKPKVAILLDYPGFNMRLGLRLKKMGIPVVYYISPQLWAWRSSRVNTLRKFVDKMLVVFPFEVDFYKQHGIDVEFVGHPLLDEWQKVQWTPAQRQMHRLRFGIENQTPLIGLMPGSRYSELKYNWEDQLQAVQLLAQRQPNAKFAWLVAPTFDLDHAKSRIPANFPHSLQILRADPFTMIQLCDVIMCASGTATLMVGLAQVPMVIMYKMNSFTAMMAKWLVKGVKYFGMVNLISEKQVVPELFQEQASPEALAEETEKLLRPEVRAHVQSDLLKLPQLLGGGHATENVAKALDEYLGVEHRGTN